MEKKVRYHLLDEARGFALVCMVFYHAFYTMADVFGLKLGQQLIEFFDPAQPYFACFFIFLSGIMCQLTRSNLKRGLKLSVVAVAITAVTHWVFPLIGIEDSGIYFGILHLLACGMLLIALINPLIKKIKNQIAPAILAIVFLFLFYITLHVDVRWGQYIGIESHHINLPEVLYKTDWLFPFGFSTGKIVSADYFPIIPWLFPFIAGAFTGLYAARNKFPNFLKPKRIPALGFVGRHSLVVYILHQPVIFAIGTAIQWIISLF